jgi:hypothetical protein
MPIAGSRRLVLVVTLTLVAAWGPLGAQSVPDLLIFPPSAKPAMQRAVPARRARRTRVNPAALNSRVLRLEMFDDQVHQVVRTTVDELGEGRAVWHGQDEDGGTVLLAVSNGIVSGAIYSDGRVFELSMNQDGEYEIAELDPSAYPTEDPVGDVSDVGGAPDRPGASVSTGTATATTTTTTVPVIDVMVLWTPAARNAVGGTVSAIQSLVTLAVANANQAYVNSHVSAKLRLVYSGELAFTEHTSAISSDISAFSSNSSVRALRSKYGADIVTMLGNGYAKAGSCGYAYIMSTLSTAFSPRAYNVVDRSCAAAYLSYAHEVGHNEGLQHDPGNASGSLPAEPYAYGYQDSSGAFRTVLSYGGGTRIPYFSSPLVAYNGRLTGTTKQDNARALRANVATVANFMAATSSSQTTVPPSCTYTLSTSVVNFGATATSTTVKVTTATGCAWTTSSSSSWLVVTPGISGPGSAKVSVTSNTGAARFGKVTIAGHAVQITQWGPS